MNQNDSLPVKNYPLKMSSHDKQARKCLVLLLFFVGLPACSPIYTWGYAPTIHPEATQAYIMAVMARENQDYTLAIEYYNTALRHTYSQKVAQERDELKQCIKHNTPCD
ncbi:MAG: hypothetical protein J6A01_12675 [Proteobacteria bacterium]|nr:hypothetical protein [Pseudomonadota bacterium]